MTVKKPVVQTDDMPSYDVEQIQSRRRFVSKTLSLSGLFAAAGISDAVFRSALTNEAHAAESRVMSDALSLAASKGSLEPALKEFDGKLSKSEISALQKITPQELRALMNIKRKIGGGSAKCCDAGTGIF